MRLLIKPRAKRQLMRIQLKNKVIEPNVNESGTDSSDDELNLAIE